MDRPLLSQVQQELIGARVRQLERVSDFLAGLRAAVQTAQDAGVIFCGQGLHDGDANHGGQYLQLCGKAHFKTAIHYSISQPRNDH